MDQSNGKMLVSALKYARLGFPVFPCVPGGKAPLTQHGFKDASTDTEQIRTWWTRNPTANVAMPTAGLLVVDVDGADNQWPGDAEKLPDLTCCPVSHTAGGGRHYIVRQPEDASWNNTASKIASKVDTRANGGYIVLPPSIVGGNPYQWADDFELKPADLPEPPGWLIELLTGTDDLFAGAVAVANEDGQVCIEGAPTVPKGATCSLDGNLIPAGQRNGTLARLAGAMRRVGMSQGEIFAALVHANQNRCQPSLSDMEVERIAASIARYEPDQVAVAVAENHWAQDAGQDTPVEDGAPAISDPGPMPKRLLRVPGFISEVMDHCMATAPIQTWCWHFQGRSRCRGYWPGGRFGIPAGTGRTYIFWVWPIRPRGKTTHVS